ncbi:hypothetical protein AB3M83_07860 [Microbacterium sp. 179-B 1A2 NHS]|uniref:hypothetical protein n=1 Tax=Microbacterium sp. 179-B 1A2 NHS TaxID=3142383 RepID=UPI0039A304CC
MASGSHDDEDAFRWDGDDDGAPPAAPPSASSLPAGWRAVGKGSADTGRTRAPADAAAVDVASAENADGTGASEPAPLGNVALVTLGLLGGIYLLYTIGWIVGGGRMLDAAVFLVAPTAVAPAVVVAVAAPALWFAVTLLLTRHRAVWLRFTGLIAGALLLVPWPFVMVGAVS